MALIYAYFILVNSPTPIFLPSVPPHCTPSLKH